MPSGYTTNLQILADLKDIHDGLMAGEIIINSWHVSHDTVTKWSIENWELVDLRPLKCKQVVKQDKMMDQLIKKLDTMIGEYAGYKNHTGLYLSLTDLQRTQTFDQHVSTGGSVSGIPGPTYITMEIRIADIYTFTQATKNVSQAITNLGKSLSTVGAAYANMSYTVNDIPLPHEKLKDLGVGIEPIVGYRDFYGVIDPVAGLILTSRNGAPWVPRNKLQALCAPRWNDRMDITKMRHDAPHEGCNCGIYAFDEPDHHDMNLSNAIWGEVNLWGNVLICESGYRAQFAYPKTLFMLDNGTQTIRYFRDRLEAIYGVPVFLVNKRDGQKLSYIIDTAVRELTKGGENS